MCRTKLPDGGSVTAGTNEKADLEKPQTFFRSGVGLPINLEKNIFMIN